LKVVIFAGGLGTRLSEETVLKPKPMVEIGGKPILWHIMKKYSNHGFKDFIILLGYKGYVIKEFFYNYYLHQNNFDINLSTNEINFHKSESENWKVSLIDTGEGTMTGGRLKRIEDYIDEDDFLLTYGDGVCDVDINKLVDFHFEKKRTLTITAVMPEGRYGQLNINKSNGDVLSFEEKPKGDGNWINGGYFVCNKKIFNYLEDDTTVFENEPMSNLASSREMNAYHHHGFWQCMDTLRDKTLLEKIYNENNAPWLI